MNLNQKYRPQTLESVQGQDIPKIMLKNIAKNPSNITRSIILYGAYGTGKTTMSLMFAKMLNCEKKDGNVCGICNFCKMITRDSAYLIEIDSSQISTVDKMREIKDSLQIGLSDGYKVIIFDEIHLVSKASFSLLLKLLEEADSSIFYLFATTDADKLLDTIKSRSIMLEFKTLSNDEIKTNLIKINELENKEPLDNEIVDFIVRRSKGHARDSLQMLDVVYLLGQELYKKNMILIDTIFHKLIYNAQKKDIVEARENIKAIIKYPVEHIRQDLDEVIKLISNSIYLNSHLNKNKLDKVIYNKIVLFYRQHHRNLLTSNDWFTFLSQLVDMIIEPQNYN